MFPVQPVLSKNFVSTGAVTRFNIPSNPVKVELYDLTNLGVTAASVAAGGAIAALYHKSYALQGMAAGSAFSTSSVASGAPPAVEQETLIGANGYTFVNTSLNAPGNAVAYTASVNGNPTVINTASTAGLLTNGSVVRLSQVAPTTMAQFMGIDFSVGTVVPATSFQLRYLDSTAIPNSGAGFYRIIPFDSLYYPRNRTILRISQAVNARITMSVDHGYTVGQQVRLIVPQGYGMTQMNGLLGTVVAVGLADASGITNTIDVNVNSTAFTPFAFPTTAVAANGVSLPQVVPVGEAATVPFQNLLDDATRNTGVVGVDAGTAVIGAAGHSMLLVAYSALSF